MISVIVPVYNVENYLEACVRSILAQTYRELEVILVNDGSTDTSLGICRKLAEEDPRIRVLDGPNGGVGSARNRGLDVAQGECIAFVDSDDTVAPAMYETMLTAMETQNADLVECGFVYVLEDGSVERYRSLGEGMAENRIECLRKFAFLENTETGPCNKLYRRRVIGDARFPGYVQGEDACFNFQVIQNCNRKITIPDCLYHYLQRQSSSTHKTVTGRELDEAKAWIHLCEELEAISPGLTSHFRRKTVDIIQRHMKEVYAVRAPHKHRVLRQLKRWYIQQYPMQFSPDKPMTLRQKTGFLIFHISPRFYFWYNR